LSFFQKRKIKNKVKTFFDFYYIKHIFFFANNIFFRLSNFSLFSPAHFAATKVLSLYKILPLWHTLVAMLPTWTQVAGCFNHVGIARTFAETSKGKK